MGKKNRRRQTKKDPLVEPTASAEEGDGSSSAWEKLNKFHASIPPFPPEDWRGAISLPQREANVTAMFESQLKYCRYSPPLEQLTRMLELSKKNEQTAFEVADKAHYENMVMLRTALPPVPPSLALPLPETDFIRWFELLKQSKYPAHYVVESVETLMAQGPEYRIALLLLIYIIIASRKNSELENVLGSSIVDEYCEDSHLAQCMNNLSKNEKEPFFLRSLAMVIRATLVATQGEVFTTAEACYRRRAVAFCEYGLSSSEIALEEVDLFLLEGKDRVINELGWPSELFSTILKESTRILRWGVGPSIPSILGNKEDNQQIISRIQTGEFDVFGRYSNRVGGGSCDRCGKRAHTEELPVLPMCSACRLAHYCSRECQAKAWESGHRHCCKKFGRFSLGDRVIVQRLTGEDSTYNGWLAVVVAKEGSSKPIVVDVISDRYVSGDVSAVRRLSVPKKNLRHLRPLA